MLTLGEIIRDLRMKSGLSQNALALTVGGVTQHYISKLEANQRYPNRRILASIIDVLLQKLEHHQDLGLIFTDLVAAVIQDAIPGTKCEILEDRRSANIIVTLQTGIKLKINLKINRIKVHEPMTQEIISNILEDLELRNAIISICRNKNLVQLIKKISKNARVLKMLSMLSEIQEDQYNLMESVLLNLPRKSKSITYTTKNSETFQIVPIRPKELAKSKKQTINTKMLTQTIVQPKHKTLEEQHQ